MSDSQATDTTGQQDQTAAPQVDNFGFPIENGGADMSDNDMNALIDRTLGLRGGNSEQATEKPANTGEASTTDVSGDTDKKPATPPDPKQEDKKTDVQPPAPQQPAAPPAPAQDEPAFELKTDDLWIEVTDANGKKTKLTLDDGIPDDFMFVNDKQLFEVMRSFSEMAHLKDTRQQAIDEAKAQQEQLKQAEMTQQEVIAGWDAEVADLISGGLMEAPKAQPGTPEWSTDPSVKQMEAVLEYMTNENVERVKDGRSPIRSFALAFNLYQKTQQASADAEAEKERQAEEKRKQELIKARGGVVGGSSAPSPDSSKYVYKRGSAKNIWQVPVDDL